MSKILENNIAEIAGVIVENFTFSHQCKGEKFYRTKIRVTRKSGRDDFVLVMVPNRLFDSSVGKDFEGLCVFVKGEFRSHNIHKNGISKLDLFVFATEMIFTEEEEHKNYVYLDGYICKPVVYRSTHLGREITDFLIAVNRKYKNSDYIPCITWSRNARYISQFPVGTEVKLEGRIQSREYLKKLDDESYETRTAYEVSVSRIDVVESEENKDESRSEENL